MLKKRRFSRKTKVRKGLLNSLMRSLVLEERITTSEAKAKEIRPRVEKAVTLAKKGTLAARRLLVRRAGGRDAAERLVKDIAPRYGERKGGYLRIIKLGARKSDGAKMAVIEFVK